MRSLLYVPGISERMILKARDSAAEALILDLEDAIAREQKAEARVMVARVLREVDFGPKEVFVRINALTTEFGADDVRAITASGSAGLLIPKVESPDDVVTVCRILTNECGEPASEQNKTSEPSRKLLCLIESPRGVLFSREIAAASPMMAGLVFGSADLVRETGCLLTEGEPELLFARSQTLLAARAAGIAAFDSPHFIIADLEGLRRSSQAARNLGYDGRTIIHPSHIAIANEVFAPSSEALAEAERIIAAMNAAQAEGRGAISLEGRLIDQVHLAAAKRLLAQARKPNTPPR